MSSSAAVFFHIQHGAKSNDVVKGASLKVPAVCRHDGHDACIVMIVGDGKTATFWKFSFQRTAEVRRATIAATMLGARSIAILRAPASIAGAGMRRPLRYLSSSSPSSLSTENDASCAGQSHEQSSSRALPPKGRNFSTRPAPAFVHDEDESEGDLDSSRIDAEQIKSSFHKRLGQPRVLINTSSSSRHKNISLPSPTHARNSVANRASPAISPRLQKLRDQLAAEDASGNQPNSLMNDISSNGSNNDASRPENEEKEPTWKQLLEAARANQHLLPQHANNNESSHQQMLTDTYNRQHTYLRISLSERCNLRCRYCMPPEGVPLNPTEATLSDEEILHLVDLFVGGGVNKIRLTGGEPLLRPTLAHLIENISQNHPTVDSVGITTNGLTLQRQLPTLLDAGLTHANISLDTLMEDRFVDITRRKGLHKVLQAIDTAVESFANRYGTDVPGRIKINCVVMKGFNDDELRDFVMLTKDRKVDVRFIEWMPFNDNGWSKGRFLGYADMLKRIRGEDGANGNGDADNATAPLDLQRLSDGPNDTTKWWSVPGHLGRVGFITSMSNNFCGTCNRLRITADGQLKVCLFGSKEVSLRDAMRDPSTTREDMELLVGAAVSRKTFALGGHGNAEGIRKANNNRPMTLIGG